MKKMIVWAALICLLLCSCTPSGGTTPAAPSTNPSVPVSTLSPVTTGTLTTAPHQEGLVYEKADDPLTPEKMASIPVAHSGMTTQQLRQLCVDYIKLSVSCQWVSDGTYYIVESDKKNPEKNFTEGKLYGGIPYINMASGNLYRFMEYYNPATGILDSTGLLTTPDLFATACSGTAGWAWARVINSAEISWTHSINKKHGFVPVGPYVYDFDMDVIWEWGPDGEKIYHYDTKKICKENGAQTMFESYAQTHLADCYSRTGHVAMASSEPVIVRDADGNIDGEKSYIELAEQGQYTKAKFHKRVTSDGTEYRIRGNDGRPFTFQALYEAGYLVHTFEEFLGTDPVEDATVTIAHRAPSATAADLGLGSLIANYPISDVFTTVVDKDGKTVFQHVERTTDHFTKTVSAAKFIPVGALAAMSTEEGRRVSITAQMSTGAIVTVYEGALIP